MDSTEIIKIILIIAFFATLIFIVWLLFKPKKPRNHATTSTEEEPLQFGVDEIKAMTKEILSKK